MSKIKGRAKCIPADREAVFLPYQSKWIKDESLAGEAAKVEARADELSPRDSRAAVREAVEKRYTLPADKPSGDVAPGDALPKR